MSVHFSLQFDSSSGQRVILSGPAEALGNYDPAKSVALEYQHSGRWCSTVTFPLLLALSPRVAPGSEEEGRAGAPASAADAPTVAADGDGTTRLVGCYGRCPSPRVRRPRVDRRPWSPRCVGIAAAIVAGQGAVAVRFVVFAPRVVAGDTVCVAGDHEALGGVDGGAIAAVPRDDTEFPYWTGTVAYPPGTSHVSYQFLIRRSAGGCGSTTTADVDTSAGGIFEVVVTETRHSRQFARLDDDVTTVRGVMDGQTAIFVPPPDPSFVHTRPWKGTGVTVPVFSFRNSTGSGVGEFVDLEAMVDVLWQY